MRRTIPPVLLLSSVLIAAVLATARAGDRQGTAPAAPAMPGAGLSVPTPEPVKAPPPLAPGPAPDLDLVFTSHVIGWIEPCG